MKKLYLPFILFLFIIKLPAQISLTYGLENISSRPLQILKKKNGNYLLSIVCIDFSQTPRRTVSKIIELNNKGKIIDSTIFNWYIDRLIPLSDDTFISLGQKYRASDSQNFFRVTRFDSKFRILNDTMIAVLDALIAPAFSMDKDSTIVFVTSSNLTNYFGKVDKYGNITSFKINNSLYDYSSNSLIIRKDSSLYTFFYSYRFITTDTAFNIQHQSKRVFPNTSIGLSPMMIPLNDTTVYVFGKGRPINATYSGLRHFFGVTTFSGQEIHKNIYSTSNDTAIWSGWYYTADTTKQREIYWAGTYNFDIGAIGYSSAASSFILHKINRDFSIKWTKRYGGDAYYELYGLLADDNGGCILYGIRYDYNLVPKHDAYILHVDANGIITSETFVPIPTPDIVVYPNPATDLLYINWQKGQNTEGGRLRLTNIQGQTVIDQYIEAGKDDYRLDVSNMAQGVYLLSLNMEGKGISTRKVLISK